MREVPIRKRETGALLIMAHEKPGKARCHMSRLTSLRISVWSASEMVPRIRTGERDARFCRTRIPTPTRPTRARATRAEIAERRRIAFGVANACLGCAVLNDIAASLLNVKRSEEHTSELQSLRHLVCRLL